MEVACEKLYAVRSDSVDLIKLIAQVINSITNTPKEFDTQMGKVGKELIRFRDTEEYAEEAYQESAYVTAVFSVTKQISELEAGKVSKEDFVINCETMCLDVSVSAIASLAGQVMIPIPVLGAVIRNVAGEFIYELCKKEGTKQSQQIIVGYNQEMSRLNQLLDIQLLQVAAKIQEALKQFEDLEKFAFNMDINEAFNSSVNLVESLEVNNNQILRTKKQIDNYFLE